MTIGGGGGGLATLHHIYMYMYVYCVRTRRCGRVVRFSEKAGCSKHVCILSGFPFESHPLAFFSNLRQPWLVKVARPVLPVFAGPLAALGTAFSWDLHPLSCLEHDNVPTSGNQQQVRPNVVIRAFFAGRAGQNKLAEWVSNTLGPMFTRCCLS